MIYCVIGNRGIGSHSTIRKAIKKLSEEGKKVNILRKYIMIKLPDQTMHNDFYISISTEDYLKMDAENMFLSKNSYTIPITADNGGEIPGTFGEFISMEDFNKAFESDDPYIVDCSPKDFRVLWSYMKVRKPKEEHYKLYPIFIKSGSEYKRLLGLVNENMTDREFHHMCKTFLATYEISESKMPEGLSVLKSDAVEYIAKTINDLDFEKLSIKPDEWKIIVKSGMIDKVAVSCI